MSEFFERFLSTEDKKRIVAVRKRKWYLANRELVNARARQYRAENLERTRAAAKAHYQANKEHKVALAKVWIAKNKTKVLGYTRKSRYGITPTEIDKMYEEQKGLCSICAKSLNPPNLDHCHTSSKIRSLLCSKCNRGLGHFNDSPELLRKAAVYVERHQTH